MKPLSLTLFFILSLFELSLAQGSNTFDIFSYKSPSGFKLENNKDYLFFSKAEGRDYCQLFLYPSRSGESDVNKDFAVNWNFFARNASQGINDPETLDYDTADGWNILFGAARGTYNRSQFVVTLTTFTYGEITFYSAAVFTNEKYLKTAQDFVGSIEPDISKTALKKNSVPEGLAVKNTAVANNNALMTKFNTTFDDGWQATAGENYVQLTKAGTEVRLHYIDGALDDARPNTIDVPEYYWSKYVEPYFNVSNRQKWSGVQYPVIYFMEADGVNKLTGKSCYIAIKVVYSGGARPIVIVAPDQNSFRGQFPHPNDADRMLNYNKFAVTAGDIIGKWNGSGGGGVEYYNVYTGTYAGMSAVSSTDEFVFNTDGTYSSMYRSASTNNSGTQFGGQDFRGKYSVTDWTITAGNRYGGKTTTFNAQLIAVKNGYLLFMADSDNSSMQYTLYRTK